MERARLLSAIRLPNNLFADYAGTEVGSDLIVLQKDTASEREYTGLEKAFVGHRTNTSSVPPPLSIRAAMWEPTPTANRHASSCMTGAWMPSLQT